VGLKYFKKFTRFVALLFAIIVLTVIPQKTFAAKCPCDIYAAGGTPCVAAHSTVRALYANYNGPLYQVRRMPDTANKIDIYPMTPGGIANSGVQDSFLGSKAGTISKIYDQSPKANHLVRTPAGGQLKIQGNEAGATGAKIMVNGHSVYGIYSYGNGFVANAAGVGYRNNTAMGLATGDQPEGMYMVCSGKHYNQWCCFDYGNAEKNNLDDGPGTMECVLFGNSTQWGHGIGTTGPWVMADLEDGLYAGSSYSDGASDSAIDADYVTAIVKGKSGNYWAIRNGHAQSGKLRTAYAGQRPTGNYNPMRKEGAIVLGIGGDNSNSGEGTFFEGAITSGYPLDTTEDAVQSNIVSVGYGSAITSVKYGANNAPRSASPCNVRYNPSTGSAIISYTLQDARRVSMNILDQQGRHIATIMNSCLPAGRHETVWNAKSIPAGVYIWKIAIDDNEKWTGKIIIGR